MGERLHVLFLFWTVCAGLEMESQPVEVYEETVKAKHAERVERCSDFTQINLEAM